MKKQHNIKMALAVLVTAALLASGCGSQSGSKSAGDAEPT